MLRFVLHFRRSFAVKLFNFLLHFFSLMGNFFILVSNLTTKRLRTSVKRFKLLCWVFLKVGFLLLYEGGQNEWQKKKKIKIIYMYASVCVCVCVFMCMYICVSMWNFVGNLRLWLRGGPLMHSKLSRECLLALYIRAQRKKRGNMCFY